jgi:hypothetical protein
MLHAISPVASFIIAAFLVAISGVAVAASLRARKIARTVASVNTSEISAATDSYVALEGTIKAVDSQTLVAPLTHASCCWFHVKVEAYESSEDSGTWRTASERTSREPFLIVDVTGECAVYPSGAEVTPTDRSVWYGPTEIPEDRNPRRVGPGDSPEGMLQVYGTPGRKFRYTEERIYDGDPLYALGKFVSTAGGEDDEDEEDEGGALGEDKFEVLDRKAKETTPRRICSTNAKQRPFLLSTTPRERFLAVNRGGSMGAMFVATIPLGLAVIFLWQRFGS